MQPQKIDLGRLQASAQPRPINPADIDRLAASIKQIGLIQPVTVRQVPGIYRGLAEQVFQIVAGHHRVAAVRSLGWTEIDAIVIETTNLNAELIEIDENLVRSELTPGQRANHISRRGEICEALAPYVPVEFQDGEDGAEESGNLIPTLASSKPKTGRGNTQFAAQTAELTGESKRSINQYRAIGDALGEDALRVGGTSLDKKAELTALAKMQPEQRAPLIARAIAGEKVTARTPPPPPAAPPPSLALPPPEPASLADVLPWDAEPPAPPAPPTPPPPATDSTLADVAAIWDAALSAACKRLGCAGTGDAVLALRELMRASPDACAAEEMQEILHDLSRWANA